MVWVQYLLSELQDCGVWGASLMLDLLLASIALFIVGSICERIKSSIWFWYFSWYFWCISSYFWVICCFISFSCVWMVNVDAISRQPCWTPWSFKIGTSIDAILKYSFHTQVDLYNGRGFWFYTYVWLRPCICNCCDMEERERSSLVDLVFASVCNAPAGVVNASCWLFTSCWGCCCCCCCWLLTLLPLAPIGWLLNPPDCDALADILSILSESRDLSLGGVLRPRCSREFRLRPERS